jgi:hypothetical protein
MDPAQEAALNQAGGGYGVDYWLACKLPAMSKVWQGIDGPSNFFLSESDYRDHGGAYEGSTADEFAETLWREAQVSPHRTHGYRQGIAEFVVDLDCPAAIGVCINNPARGRGGVIQYYIPNWERYLMKTGREFRFAAKSR